MLLSRRFLLQEARGKLQRSLERHGLSQPPLDIKRWLLCRRMGRGTRLLLPQSEAELRGEKLSKLLPHAYGNTEESHCDVETVPRDGKRPDQFRPDSWLPVIGVTSMRAVVHHLPECYVHRLRLPQDESHGTTEHLEVTQLGPFGYLPVYLRGLLRESEGTLRIAGVVRLEGQCVELICHTQFVASAPLERQALLDIGP